MPPVVNAAVVKEPLVPARLPLPPAVGPDSVHEAVWVEVQVIVLVAPLATTGGWAAMDNVGLVELVAPALVVPPPPPPLPQPPSSNTNAAMVPTACANDRESNLHMMALLRIGILAGVWDGIGPSGAHHATAMMLWASCRKKSAVVVGL